MGTPGRVLDSTPGSRLFDPSTHSLARREGGGRWTVPSQGDLQRGRPTPRALPFDRVTGFGTAEAQPQQRGLRADPLLQPAPLPAALRPPRWPWRSLVCPKPRRGARAREGAEDRSSPPRQDFRAAPVYREDALSLSKSCGDVSCSSHCAGSRFVYQF